MYKHRQEKEKKRNKIDEILKEDKEDLKVLKSDPTLDKFAEQLQQREQQKLTAQLQRVELVQEQCSPGIYPQLKCDRFIEGLDFVGPGWRHLFKKKPLRKKEKMKELEEMVQAAINERAKKRARRKKKKVQRKTPGKNFGGQKKILPTAPGKKGRGSQKIPGKVQESSRESKKICKSPPGKNSYVSKEISRDTTRFTRL